MFCTTSTLRHNRAKRRRLSARLALENRTLVNLIPRFYDVTDGAILIDGTDIREVTQSDLREQIGYVPQKGNLFSGTIDSNLRDPAMRTPARNC